VPSLSVGFPCLRQLSQTPSTYKRILGRPNKQKVVIDKAYLIQYSLIICNRHIHSLRFEQAPAMGWYIPRVGDGKSRSTIAYKR